MGGSKRKGPRLTKVGLHLLGGGKGKLERGDDKRRAYVPTDTQIGVAGQSQEILDERPGQCLGRL